MGVTIRGPERGKIEIDGVGRHGLKAPANVLDMGNSGTSIRLLSGLLAAQPFDSTMTGDVSLQKRPMGRVTAPLEAMGAVIESDEGRPPLHIKGGRPLKSIHYEMPVASAQVKSCVLLAGLYAEGRTSVTEPAPTRDHTERMLRGFGYDVECENEVISLQGGGVLRAATLDIPADISSAAFFLVAASIAEGSDLTLEHVGMNPTRSGVITILTLMGADIEVLNEREVGGEPVATGSPPTSRSFNTSISAPMSVKIVMTPDRVGFIPTCSRVRSEPSAIDAATRKKAADEMSAGISSVAARKTPPPCKLMTSFSHSTS